MKGVETSAKKNALFAPIERGKTNFIESVGGSVGRMEEEKMLSIGEKDRPTIRNDGSVGRRLCNRFRSSPARRNHSCWTGDGGSKHDYITASPTAAAPLGSVADYGGRAAIQVESPELPVHEKRDGVSVWRPEGKESFFRIAQGGCFQLGERPDPDEVLPVLLCDKGKATAVRGKRGRSIAVQGLKLRSRWRENVGAQHSLRARRRPERG